MKKISVLMLLMLSLIPLFAVEETIDIEAVVPEDYGIIIPDTVAIDRLLFEVKLESGEDILLEESDVSLGELTVGKGETSFTLLYYGNLASEYDVVLRAVSSGLYSENGEGHIPLDIEIRRDEDCLPEIETTSFSREEMHLVVPSMGALEAEPVLDFNVTWDNPMDLPLGRYVGTIDVELRSN